MLESQSKLKQAALAAGIFLSSLGGGAEKAQAKTPTSPTHETGAKDAFDELDALGTEGNQYKVTLDTREGVEHEKKESFDDKYSSLLGKINVMLHTLESAGKITSKKADTLAATFRKSIDDMLANPKIKGNSDAENFVFEEFSRRAEVAMAGALVDKVEDAEVNESPDTSSVRDRAKGLSIKMENYIKSAQKFLNPTLDFDTALNHLKSVLKENGTFDYKGIQFFQIGERVGWRLDSSSRGFKLEDESHRDHLNKILEQAREEMKKNFGVTM